MNRMIRHDICEGIARTRRDRFAVHRERIQPIVSGREYGECPVIAITDENLSLWRKTAVLPGSGRDHRFQPERGMNRLICRHIRESVS